MPTPSAAAPAAAEPWLERAAFATLDRRLDRASDAPVVVALSGGGDSVALLAIAALWAEAARRSLLAITIDHGLNPDSQQWSALAARAAERHGAGWLGLEWRGDKPAAGLPAAARRARHALMADAARKAGAHVMLTGHTADDVAEGEVMRGSDAPGLGRLREWSPSPAWPEGRGLFLLRPLLGLGREALRDWLRARGETWIDDPANADLRFARSRARLRLSPEDEPAPDDAAPGDSAKLDAGMTADGRLRLRRADIDARALSAALVCAAGGDEPPRRVQIDRLLDRLSGPAPVDATLAGARLVAAGETIEIGRDAGERFRGGLEPLPLPVGEAVVWDGRFEIVADGPELMVQPLGGVIARLGPRDRAALKAIPPWARGAIPALVSPDLAVTLPRPLGDGMAVANPLAGARLIGTVGLVTDESTLDHASHGAGGFVTLC